MNERNLWMLLGVFSLFSLFTLFVLSDANISGMPIYDPSKQLRSGRFGVFSQDFKQPYYFTCYDHCDKVGNEKGLDCYYGTQCYSECVQNCLQDVPYNRVRLPAKKFYQDQAPDYNQLYATYGYKR